jgi:hypothetical protein
MFRQTDTRKRLSREVRWLVLLFATALSFTAGCAPGAVLVHDYDAERPVTHSLIFVIHGDGQYGYLDANGRVVQADQVTFEKARAIAMANPTAEVLIFHERSPERRLLFFTRPDGSFHYYRDGREVFSDSFRRSGRDRMAPIMQRVDRFASGAPVRMFFYFGHEIPEAAVPGYDSSYPLRPFGLAQFRDAVRRMTTGKGPFDMLALSTCNGGTPQTIRALSPHARFVLASPDNLHLSYLDLSPLDDLTTSVPSGDAVRDLADTLAHRSYERLTEAVHTTVSIAVYDTERTAPYLARVLGLRPDEQKGAAGDSTVIEPLDCARHPAFADEGMREGVRLYYRPARFGRAQFQTEHSGWTCIRPAD